MGVKYKNSLPIQHKVYRLIWQTVWMLFKHIPRGYIGSSLRVIILRLFGADIGVGVNIYPNVEIYYPRNLKIGSDVGIDSNVRLYNVDLIEIKDHVTISQGAFLCTASHDYKKSTFDLISDSIKIQSGVWIAADTMIHMGVKIVDGCVVAARSVVTKSIEKKGVYAGNPAVLIKRI